MWLFGSLPVGSARILTYTSRSFWMKSVSEKPGDFAVPPFVSVGSGTIVLTGGLPIAYYIHTDSFSYVVAAYK